MAPYINYDSQVRTMEHDSDAPETRKVSLYGYDSADLVKRRVRVNSDGELIVAGGSSNDMEGADVTVGTVAVEMTFAGDTQGVQIQADHDNTGTIWVGKSNVSSAGANAFTRLEAGESISVDYDDGDNAIYAISDTASQKVYKFAVI